MLIDEELILKKLEVFLAFMRTGNLARAAAELQTSNVSGPQRARHLDEHQGWRFRDGGGADLRQRTRWPLGICSRHHQLDRRTLRTPRHPASRDARAVWPQGNVHDCVGAR